MNFKKVFPFLLLAIAGIGGVYYIRNRLWGSVWKETYKVNMVVSDVDGLVAGTNVLFDGVNVGMVKDLTLLNPGVSVELSLVKSIRIPDNAIFKIEPKGMVGGLQIRISNNEENISTSYLKDGSIVVGLRAATTAAVLSNIFNVTSRADDLLENLPIKNVVNNLDGIVTQIKENDVDRVGQILENIEIITEDIKELAQSQSSRTILDGAASFSSFLGGIFGSPRVYLSFIAPISKPLQGYKGEVGFETRSIFFFKTNLSDWSKGYSFLLKRDFNITNWFRLSAGGGVIRDSFGIYSRASLIDLLIAEGRLYNFVERNFEVLLGVKVTFFIAGILFNNSGLNFNLRFSAGL